MKKVLFFNLFLLCSGFSVFSQEFVRFGVLAGVDYTTKIHLYDSEFSEYNNSDNYKIGYVVGMTSEIGIIKNISVQIQPELLKAGSNNASLIREYTYLNFPLELKFFSNKFISPFIGGYYSYLTSYRVKGEDTGNKWYSDYDFATHYDMGLNFGLSFKISERIRLNAKYILGLINSNTISPSFHGIYFNDAVPHKDYNRGFCAYLTYFFIK